MGGRNEASFESTRREVNAPFEGICEKVLEEVGTGAGGIGQVTHRGFGKEEAEHRTGLRHLEGKTLFAGGLEESVPDGAAHSIKPFVGIFLPKEVEGGHAGGHREGISGKCSGLVDRADRGELLHEVASSPEGADGQTAPDDFSHGGKVRGNAGLFLDPSGGDPKAGHDLVKNKNGSVAGTDLAQLLEKAFIGKDESTVGRIGLDDKARDGFALSGKKGLKGGDVVKLENAGFSGKGGRDPGAVRIALGEGTGASPDKKGINMAVVATGKLDNDVPASCSPGKANGTHGGFGSGIAESDLLKGRDHGNDCLGDLDLVGIRGSKAGPRGEGGRDRLPDLGRIVTVNGRSPGTDKIDKLAPIGGGEATSAGRLGEKGRPTDRAKGAHRGIDASRDEPAGFLKQCLRTIHEDERINPDRVLAMPKAGKYPLGLEIQPPAGFQVPQKRHWGDNASMVVSPHGSPSLSVPALPARQEALQGLRTFLPSLPAYQEGRSFDRPQAQAVSTLSPYVRYRLLSERDISLAVMNRYKDGEADTFLRQVGWRTYFKGYLEQRPSIWSDYRQDLKVLGEELSNEAGERLGQAKAGKTGIAPFDAWVNELRETGWLHNHARMWFASIWIFTLKLPWQAGSAFFLEHLLDGDPASNTLSWRWVAGLHTRGKHYLARAGNIRKFTDGRFNPEGQLNEDADPLPPDGPYAAEPLPHVSSLADLQFPSLSCCPAGLLVTPEDLSPETSELSETPFSSICVLAGNDVAEEMGYSAGVTRFIKGAVADAGDRLSSHWDGKVLGCSSEVFQMVGKACPENVGRLERMRVYSGDVNDWVQSVLTWAQNEHLKSVWMLRPTVGPYADRLPALKAALDRRKIHLLEYRRRWDSLHWPHATRGYFPFKKGFPERVRRSLSQ